MTIPSDNAGSQTPDDASDGLAQADQAECGRQKKQREPDVGNIHG